MTEQQIAAMRQALEALNEYCEHGAIFMPITARDTLTAVLADNALDKMAENAREIGLDYEPAQQEPLGYFKLGGFNVWWQVSRADSDIQGVVPLYTRPQAREPVIDKSAAIRIATALGWEPKREPLTDDEIKTIWGSYFSRGLEFARAIEAAHGITGEKK